MKQDGGATYSSKWWHTDSEEMLEYEEYKCEEMTAIS